MGKVLQFVTDRLTNIMSGMGTTADRRSYLSYHFMPMTPQEAEAAYRESWLARKIIDVPALDMTREWRAWQAEGADIEKIEAEERRLQLRAKCKRALILARLYGGGAILMGTRDSDPLQPINPKVGAGGLTYLHVLSRHQLSLGPEIRDPTSEWFGKPEWFQINTIDAGQNIRVHPSRVVEFIGQPAPEGSLYLQDWFWGDPIMQSIGEAIRNADMAQAGFAALIDEAKLDIIKIPDLMSHWATDEHESRLTARLNAAKLGQSTWRAKILDKEEEWEHREVTWAGIPDVIGAFLNIVAGAADIPVTRLLGQSPKGLQSTGDGEERDYHAMVKARQNELLAPALDRIDQLLIPSALSSMPSDIYYEFNSLDQPDEAKDSEIEKRAADTIKVYSDTGLISDEALAEIAKNRMIESGRWPGCEAAFEANPDLPEEEPNPDAGKTMAELAAEKAETLRAVGTIDDAQAVALVTDARPRTLYVSRKLVNADDLLRWAKGQGIPEPMDAGSLHVTICYSHTPLDWLKVDAEDWNQEKDGTITVPPGGARIVERLGDKGAVALLFSSSRLSWRHEQIMRAGGSHDFEEFTPHVTVSWNVPADFDLDAVEPYRGKLVFGPEIFAEIDEDWTPPVNKGVGEAAATPFDLSDAFDPNQPRDRFGRWTSVGALNFIQQASTSVHVKLAAHEIGQVTEEVHLALERMGIQRRPRSVKLDQSRVRHILKYHGPSSGDRNPVDAIDIANAHRILNAATLQKGTPFKVRGGHLVHATAKVAGRTYGAVFEVRRNSIVPFTLYHPRRK